MLWDPKSRKMDLSVGTETTALEHVMETMTNHNQNTRLSSLSNQMIIHSTVFVLCAHCETPMKANSWCLTLRIPLHTSQHRKKITVRMIDPISDTGVMVMRLQ